MVIVMVVVMVGVGLVLGFLGVGGFVVLGFGVGILGKSGEECLKEMEVEMVL